MRWILTNGKKMSTTTMKTVNLKLKLELLDEDDFNTNWIKEAIEDSLMEADGERIIEFKVIPESFYTDTLVVSANSFSTEYDESDDIEGVKTITPYGKI